MKLIQKASLLLLTALLCGPTEREFFRPTAFKDITLVFHRIPPGKSDKNKKSALPPNQILYNTSDISEIQIELNNRHAPDTIRISEKSERTPISFLYKNITYHYVFEQGDSVIFDFKKGFPVAAVTNRNYTDSDLNASLYQKIRFGEKLYMSEIPVITFVPQSNLNETNKINEDLVKIENRRKKSRAYIDSLKENRAVSAITYDLLLAQSECISAGNILSDVRFKKLPDGASAHSNVDNILNNAEWLRYTFFTDFLLSTYLYSYVLNVPKIKSASSVTLDYKIAYDRVDSLTINKEVKSYILSECLLALKSKDTKENFENYLSRFRKDTPQDIYLKYANKFKPEPPVNAKEGHDVLLEYANGAELLLSELISASKGQVIYVDLWASWCAPCRQAMPSSLKLREQLKDKPVKFVYISLDEDIEKWRRAAKIEKLDSYKYSYLLLNPRNAKLINDIKLKSIPRYLIYDKDGKLAYSSSPGPENPNIVPVLNQFIH